MANALSPSAAQRLIDALDAATAANTGKQFFHAFLDELGRQLGDLGDLGRRFDAELNGLGVPSSRDEAVGLLGQQAFLDAFSLEFQRTQRHGRPLSVLMLSIDRIAEIVGRDGETAGQEVLYAVAALLRKKLRNSDLICRLANEGFVMVLPETGTLGAKDAAEKIRLAIERREGGLADTPPITVSIGVTVVSGIERNYEEILNLADRALADAQSLGGNRICSGLGIL